MASTKRVVVFIDGNNFYYGLRKIYGKDKSLKNFDFEAFSKFLAKTNKVYYIIKEDDINMAVDMVERACGDNYDIALVVIG